MHDFQGKQKKDKGTPTKKGKMNLGFMKATKDGKAPAKAKPAAVDFAGDKADVVKVCVQLLFLLHSITGSIHSHKSLDISVTVIRSP